VDPNELLRIVDVATADAVRRSGGHVVCRPGCCECCLGPFEITELDAARLREGLEQRGPAQRAEIVRRAQRFQGDDDEPCPVLNPETGTCELYAWRPITCRRFGPPMRYAGSHITICELCFQGASDDEIAACAVDVNIEEQEGVTTVAACLAALHAE
jgi:Fe-S-cluster containining protein